MGALAAEGRASVPASPSLSLHGGLARAGSRRQVTLVPPQIMPMIAAAASAIIAAAARSPPSRAVATAVPSRPARPDRITDTSASTAIAANTSPITANPDASNGTWSWSRTSSEYARNANPPTSAMNRITRRGVIETGPRCGPRRRCGARVAAGGLEVIAPEGSRRPRPGWRGSAGGRRRARLGPVVDGDVPAEPRAAERRGGRLPPLAERRQALARVLDRRERPEAVDDADLERAAAQEGAVAPAPQHELGCVVATQRGDVVAAVVMNDQQPAAGPEHAVHLGEVAGVDATEPGPPRHHRGLCPGAGVEPQRRHGRDDPGRRSGDETSGSEARRPVGARDVEHHRLARAGHPEIDERPTQLAFDVHDRAEALEDVGEARGGRVDHGRRGYA